MKSFAKNLISRLISCAYRQLPVMGVDGFDISEIIKLKAAMDSAEYCMEHMPRVRVFDSASDQLTFALKQVTLSGSYLEFGVASGSTINHISRQTHTTIHGFDSFKGLPEDWQVGYPKETFAQKIPKLNKNVELHVGLFSKTLPAFVDANKEPVAFLHIDCDLYSSAKEVLHCLDSRIVPGTVIVFDEYLNHPTWRRDEWLAFQEFIKDRGLHYAYVGYVPSHQQVCVVIKGS